jgi:hypothetical protein
VSTLQASTRREMVEVRRNHFANEIDGGVLAHAIGERCGLRQRHEQRGLVIRDRRSPSFREQQRAECVSHIVEAPRFETVESYAVDTCDWRFLDDFDTHSKPQAVLSRMPAKLIPSGDVNTSDATSYRVVRQAAPSQNDARAGVLTWQRPNRRSQLLVAYLQQQRKSTDAVADTHAVRGPRW